MDNSSRLKTWFYRFTAAHFCLTAITGGLLYFRPLDDREGWYSESLKEILVGLHNGELWGRLLLDSRYSSGLPIGFILASVLVYFSFRTFFNRKTGRQK